MKSEKVKIGELNFEIKIPEDPEIMPTFEIENDASMIYLNVDTQKALELKTLIDDYLNITKES